MNTSRMALFISLIYCAIAVVWIYVSDRLLPRFATTALDITTLAIYKGLFFISATSLFLYLTIHYFAKGRCNRCRSVLGTINDAVIIYDLDTGSILEANRMADEIFGGGSQGFQAGIPPKGTGQHHDRWKEPREWFAKARDEGLEKFEWETRTADGRGVWLDVRLQETAVNGLTRLIAVARDISERKLAENSLQRLNRTLRMLLACNEILIRARDEGELFRDICTTIVDDGSYRFAWIGLAGADPDKSVRPAAHAGFVNGSPMMTNISWRDNEHGRGPTGTAIREGLPCMVRDVQNDIRFLPWREEARRCGYVSVLSVPLVYSGMVFGALTVGACEADAFHDEEMSLMIQLAGEMAYGIASLRTAADQKRIEEALIKSEKNLSEAQSIASLGSWEYDLVTDEEYRSDEFFRILGLPPRENGRAVDSVFDYIHPDDRDLVKKKITETLEQGRPYEAEYRIIRADGSERFLHARGKTLRDSEGRTTKFIGTALDITGRKMADTALRESELRFRTLVETSTDWIWEVDENSVYVYSSPKVRELLGYEPEEIIGRTPFELMHPQEAHRMAQVFTRIRQERKPFSGLENLNLHKNGGMVTIETSGTPVFDGNGKFCGYRGIDRDVTDRKKLEEKYLQAQKMEAVGQLAGGISHDFNNILTAIIGFQHLLLETVEGEKPRYFAKQVLSLAEKASHLTRDLLAFSRKQTIHPRHLDTNETIRKIGKILKRLIGEDIDLQLNLHENPLPVLAVMGHVEQVFMNLATNARDAMPDGGLLTITTEEVEIDASFVRLHGHGEAGKYALISFSDTGCGMDEATRLRVFEPFFTTKEVGKGTGLGLSTVYGIIHQHEGFISVYSEPGEGTTFRIYLPLIDSEETGESDIRSELLPPRGKETVLLAEDEPEVRQVISTLLEKNGYRVIIAVDGEHALERYVECEDIIDLLILDVIMPKKNGKEVYDLISRARKEIRTIFVSGYTADIVEQKGIPATCHLVSKPFSPHAFLWKVREVLDAASPASAEAGEMNSPE